MDWNDLKIDWNGWKWVVMTEKWTGIVEYELKRLEMD